MICRERDNGLRKPLVYPDCRRNCPNEYNPRITSAYQKLPKIIIPRLVGNGKNTLAQ